MIGKRLRELRQLSGLGQIDIAKAVGVAPTTYASWEQDRSKPSIDLLPALSKVFDVSIDYILSNSASKAIDDPDYAAYESLTDDDRETVKRVLDALKAREKDAAS